MPLRLYNTATRILEEFVPLSSEKVTMYNCGPTVYDYAHIGNLRPYVFADILRRTLESNGHEVRQVINITDVGHLVGDGDVGDDKMTSALRREGKPLTKEAMREVGDRYTTAFENDLELLNIKKPALMPKASDHIAEDIALVSLLLEKDHAYKTTDGVYFDTSTFPHYADFAKLDVSGMRAGERVGMGDKKHSTDFALWKFNDALGWEASFGKGFPGWHIECSAMIKKHLGHPIDIHTGGVDHIPVHHTNEIAQSESAYGSPFVKTWMHCAHMTLAGEKMSKSLGNTYSLRDLHERGIPPLAYRYFLLTAHYRTQINITWEALAAAQSAYNKLTNVVIGIKDAEGGSVLKTYMDEFSEAMNDDLNTASAVATLWKLVKDATQSDADKYATLLHMDKFLGLGLEFTHLVHSVAKVTDPQILELFDQRQRARDLKNYAESDRLRDEIKKLGYEVKDTPEGQLLEPIK